MPFDINRFLLLVTLTFCAVSPLLGQQNGMLTPTPIPTRSSQVVQELASVTNNRAILLERARRYGNMLAELKLMYSQAKAKCNCQAHPTPVAFTAFLDAKVPVFGQDQPMPFTNVSINQGNGYDSRHAAFRAPINGTYIFYMNIATQTGYQIVVDLMKNGVPVIKLRTGNANQWNTATNTAVLQLAAGDDVWVQHDKAITDSNVLFKGDGLYTSFTGHLLNNS